MPPSEARGSGVVLDFRSKLELLARGRKLTPWLTSIGWTKRDVTRAAKHNHVPGPAKLALLAKHEHANISWLIADVGQPYLDPRFGLQLAEPATPPLDPKIAALRDELLALDDESLKVLMQLARLLRRMQKPKA